MPSLLAALKLPGFARLATAYTVNELGNWLGDIALAVLVYDQTGSPFATAALFIGTRFLPAFIAPAVAVRLEPIDTRWALAFVYLAEAVAFAALALSANHFLLVLTVALATIDGTLASTGRSLTRAAAVSMLGSHGALRSGNAVLNFGFTGAAAAGPAIAGLVVATFGVQTALLLDAGSFVIVALMLASATSLPSGAVVPAGWWSRLQEGIRYVRARSTLRGLLAAQGLALVFFTAVTPIEVVYVKETLGAGDFGFGALLASWGVGMVIGSLLFAIGRKMPLGPLLFASTLSVAVSYLGLAAAPTLLVACVVSAFGGAGNGVQLVSLISAIQEFTAPGFQVRVASLLESLAAVMPGVGFLLGGTTAALLSPRVSYLVAGTGVAVVAVVAAIVLSGREWHSTDSATRPLGDQRLNGAGGRCTPTRKATVDLDAEENGGYQWRNTEHSRNA